MVKLNMWVRRLPELDVAGFQDYWRDRHGPLVLSHAKLLRIRRYVQTAPLPQPALQEALRAGRGALEADFDGCAELWWDSMEDHLAARSSTAGMAALRELVEDERRFIDLSRSLLWYGDEREIVPGA